MNSQTKTIDPTAPSSSIKLVSNSAINGPLASPKGYNRYLVSPNSPNNLSNKLLSIKTQNSIIDKFQ